MFFLTNNIAFPPCHLASKDGVIAFGGDLSEKRLIDDYQQGIFPWYSKGEPIVWYCPEKRMVLFPEDLKISKSMRKIIKKNEFVITENQAFKEVIYQCKTIHRNDEFGTWITDEMEQAYINLHKKEIAKSIEVWLGSELVGGLYGVDLGTVFCGESMFSKISNTSKLAFIFLSQKKQYQFIDCQVYNKHLENLGAKEISRNQFLKLLKINKKNLTNE